MLYGSSPAAIATRFSALSQAFITDGPAERADRARRSLLAGIAANEPATLNAVAAAVQRGAPLVSRAVDALVRSGLVAREADPDNRRRLALRLTPEGQAILSSAPKAGTGLETKLSRLAPSELRAIERGIEILERAAGL
ncbi:MAG TPA: MarR family transcriptional regulator [Sphingomicrobium sp.]|nr:MarR family transcriptional regulator [Sphingomicrobium sp.]